MANPIATQEVFARTDANSEPWDVAAATPKNTLVKQAASGRYGVTLTDTEGVAKPDVVIYGDVKVTGLTRPGVGVDKATAIGEFVSGVALDGTWEFTDIEGALIDTPQGTPVYITDAGTLTLTEDTNDRVGVVNFPATYPKAAGKLPVKIGA